jgi:BASS family bile acid:Na+ symporter
VTPHTTALARVLHAVQERLVVVLVGVYALAAWIPAPGLALRSVSAGSVGVAGTTIDLTLPKLFLALLLFDASLGVDLLALRRLRHRPSLVVAGLVANVLLPLTFVVVASLSLASWHNPDEVQSLLVGLTIVASMPIAGSSTAWAQNAEGNLALSLGMVFGSTIISPWITPLGFRSIAQVTTGDYAEDLLELAGESTQLFLVAIIVVPALAGLLARGVAGPARVARVLPGVKLANLVALLLLNYSNACVALPQVTAQPDWDFLAMITATAATLSALTFLAGHTLGRALRTDAPERTALIFALGMNNNGSGLVIAAATLADHPNVLLTIVVYNLVQQVAAGVVDHLLLRTREKQQI